jgi:hypothetical protein
LPSEAKRFKRKIFPFLFTFVWHFSQRRAWIVQSVQRLATGWTAVGSVFETR